ncbi:hypothetical protein FAZ19_09600 [Sphingobacterium alkalisoli]|uniref:Uncharacterized protein n=1 Tax=Sphingobacterium alkalisoli TaxID=1874115 RepID=A0A4V5LYM3_9SPHI|nr:hypothetical protein [Sphingobacterium alkalisoli]TJY67129.1 hypothetical protein FAZ19_09600 [Sphingobacterium alkalisoli]
MRSRDPYRSGISPRNAVDQCHISRLTTPEQGKFARIPHSVANSLLGGGNRAAGRAVDNCHTAFRPKTSNE